MIGLSDRSCVVPSSDPRVLLNLGSKKQPRWAKPVGIDAYIGSAGDIITEYAVTPRHNEFL